MFNFSSSAGMASLPGAFALETCLPGSAQRYLAQSPVLSVRARREVGRCHQGRVPLSIAQNSVPSNGPVAGSCF